MLGQLRLHIASVNLTSFAPPNYPCFKIPAFPWVKLQSTSEFEFVMNLEHKYSRACFCRWCLLTMRYAPPSLVLVVCVTCVCGLSSFHHSRESTTSTAVWTPWRQTPRNRPLPASPFCLLREWPLVGMATNYVSPLPHLKFCNKVRCSNRE